MYNVDHGLVSSLEMYREKVRAKRNEGQPTHSLKCTNGVSITEGRVVNGSKTRALSNKLTKRLEFS